MGVCKREGDKLVLEGEFTIEHASTLKDFLSAAMATGGSLSVDLAGVTKVDITLFQLLVALAKSLGKAGADVRCSGLNEHLASIAESAGVKDILPLRID